SEHRNSYVLQDGLRIEHDEVTIPGCFVDRNKRFDITDSRFERLSLITTQGARVCSDLVVDSLFDTLSISLCFDDRVDSARQRKNMCERAGRCSLRLMNQFNLSVDNVFASLAKSGKQHDEREVIAAGCYHR